MTKLAITPYDYQVEDMRFLIREKKAALLHEPGVGKTLGTLLALTWVLESEDGKGLIVVPSILIDTWYDKIYDYFDTNLTVLKYKGTLSERKKMNIEGHRIVIVSYDILQRDYDILSKIQWKYLVSDETKYVKIGEVKRSKKTGRMNKFGCVNALAYKTEYLTLMNGTPITKSPADVFHIIQLINPNAYVSMKNFLRFHAIYRRDDSGFPVISGWIKLDLMKNLLNKISRRLIKSEVLELPKKQLIIKQFSLSDKHQKRLKELWEFGFLELSDDNIFLEGMALLMTVRRAMIDTSLLELKETSAYIEALEDLLDELQGEQVIIYTHFHSTVDILKKRFKFRELNGRVSAKQKDQTIKDFKDRKFNLLVASAKSAGIGLDFQQCHNVIFFELDYTPDDFWQGIDRTHRPGQEHEVNIYVLLAKATPAVALFRSIMTNIDYVRKILEGKEDASTLFENKITVKEEQRWKKL